MSCPSQRRKLSVITRAIALAVMTAYSATVCGACGIAWAVLPTHFEGVNENGKVFLADKVCEVDFGDDLVLPIITEFRSDRETASPYLGKGWMLPLLESNIVQTSETAFQMTLPDGWTKPLYRTSAKDSVLDGRSWKGEIKGEVIQVWADCGWKLEFLRGRLSKLTTPAGRVLEWVRSGHRIAEIRVDGATKLSVEWDGKTESAQTLVATGKRIAFSLAPRPRVKTINKMNLVEGLDLSLNRVDGGDGERVYEFATTEKLEPTLDVSRPLTEKRHFVWNPQDGTVRTEGEWKYSVADGIERRSTNGTRDYWKRDELKGEEIVETEGVRTLTKQFASGKLAGLVRQKWETQNGKTELIYSATYDENAKLVRAKEREFELIYSPASGSVVKILRAGKVVFEDNVLLE